MCRSSNFNYNLHASIDSSAIGVPSSQIVAGLTSSLSSALENVNVVETGKSQQGSRKQRHHHIVVEHHYHDHATENESIDERPARGGVTTPFPIRLHKMLDKMEADGHADVISWQPHGRCFVVRKPKEFKELLPIYFKLSKMSSFQRQLNLYGFQRLTRGRDKNGYYHEYFLRGKAALSHKIQRTKVKGTGVRARSNPTSEPHLWEMTWVGMEAATQNHGDAGSVSSHEDHYETHYKSSSVPPLKEEEEEPTFSVHSSSAFCSLPPLKGSSTTMPMSSTLAPTAVDSSPFMVPSWTQQQPIMQQQQQQQAAQMDPFLTASERDVIMSFGGKQFHYLDPKEMAREAELRKKQVDACQRDDMQAFMTNLELDNLYSEIDDERMDDDGAFMDMLERVIE